MTDLPHPPVPADCDLRDFPFYQIDVVRLRDSELVGAADAEVFRCAVLSWCYAWHQVPAGSLPDDDATLARALGFGRDVRGWKKVRAAGGLRGWYKASDGRLYHRLVAEKATHAWQRKLMQRWGTECARIKKHNQRHNTAVPVPDFETWMSHGCPQGQMLPVPGDNGGETYSKGEGEGQGQLKGEGQGERDSNTPPPSPSSAAPARADAPAPPGGGDGVRQRITGIRSSEVASAVQGGDFVGVVKAFGGTLNPTTRSEWVRDASGMQLGELATVLWMAMREGRPIRQPSGLRKARVEFEALTIEDRRAICAAAVKDMGIHVPSKGTA